MTEAVKLLLIRAALPPLREMIHEGLILLLDAELVANQPQA